MGSAHLPRFLLRSAGTCRTPTCRTPTWALLFSNVLHVRLHFEQLAEATAFFIFALLHLLLFDHLLDGLVRDCGVDVFFLVFSASSVRHLADPVGFYGEAQQERAAIFLNCGLIGDCRNKQRRCEQEGLPSPIPRNT